LDIDEFKPKLYVFIILVDASIKLFGNSENIIFFRCRWSLCKVELEERLTCEQLLFCCKLLKASILIALIIKVAVGTDFVLIRINIFLVDDLIEFTNYLDGFYPLLSLKTDYFFKAILRV
jgi:hypothetical protein